MKARIPIGYAEELEKEKRNSKKDNALEFVAKMKAEERIKKAKLLNIENSSNYPVKVDNVNFFPIYIYVNLWSPM